MVVNWSKKNMTEAWTKKTMIMAPPDWEATIFAMWPMIIRPAVATTRGPRRS